MSEPDSDLFNSLAAVIGEDCLPPEIESNLRGELHVLICFIAISIIYSIFVILVCVQFAVIFDTSLLLLVLFTQ